MPRMAGVHPVAVSFDAWRQSVDREMKAAYLIDMTDAGWAPSDLETFWRERWTPTAFVSWFAEKYGLTHVDDTGWGRGAYQPLK